MKIAMVGYRDWAIKIYETISSENTNHSYLKIYSEQEFSKSLIIDFDPDVILFYGWSKIVSSDIVNNFTCLMLHPSPLPKYRGGSPIQNQIIRGEKESAVSIFIADEGIDTGEIIGQKNISLEGNIPDIFNRFIGPGIEITTKFLSGDFIKTKQDSSESTYFKRRKPSQSEITMEELVSSSGEYIFNKIRMLTGPYPTAYIKTCDGKKILIKDAELVE